ncbi:MAG: hypothetical protein QOE90_3638 [Thermoplasmata archaeon]|jgi:hypothetical protein|nr:hypothetical protein [Thermoplasmata archaeon]
MRAALLVVLLLAGCATEAEVPVLAHARVDALAVTPACVPRGATITLSVTISNPTDEAGEIRFALYAQQVGNLVEAREPLAPHETRNVSYQATADVVGRTTIYATGADVRAGQAQLVVADPDSNPPVRCP